MNKQLNIVMWLILAALTLGGCNNSHGGGGGSNFDLHEVTFAVSQPSQKQTGSFFELGRLKVNQVNPDVVVGQTMQSPSVYPNRTTLTSLRGVFIATDPALTAVEYHLMVDGKEVAASQVITNVEVVVPVGFTLVGSRSYDFRLTVFSNFLIPGGTLEFMPIELTKTGVSVSLPFALDQIQCNPGGNQLPAATSQRNANDTYFVAGQATLYNEDVFSVTTVDQSITDYTFSVNMVPGFSGAARLFVDGVEMDSAPLDGSNGTPIPFKLFPKSNLPAGGQRNIQLRIEAVGGSPGTSAQASRVSYGTEIGVQTFIQQGDAALLQ